MYFNGYWLLFCLFNFDSNSMLGLMMTRSFSVPDCLCSHSYVQGTLNIAYASAYLSLGTQRAPRSATVHTHGEIYLSLCSLGQFEILKYRAKVKYSRSPQKSVHNKKANSVWFCCSREDTWGMLASQKGTRTSVVLACSPSRWFLVRGMKTGATWVIHPQEAALTSSKRRISSGWVDVVQCILFILKKQCLIATILLFSFYPWSLLQPEGWPSREVRSWGGTEHVKLYHKKWYRNAASIPLTHFPGNTLWAKHFSNCTLTRPMIIGSLYFNAEQLTKI